MHRGPTACQSVSWLQARQLLTDNDQAHVHTAHADADRAVQQMAIFSVTAAHTAKGIETVATKAQHVGIDAGAIAERDTLAARDDGEIATHSDKAGNIQIQGATRLDQFAVCAV